MSFHCAAKKNSEANNASEYFRNRWTRLSAWIAIICFTSTSVVSVPSGFAQTVQAGINKEIKGIDQTALPVDIPTDLGLLKDYYQPRMTGDSPFVIHIQDAHANPDAQEKIRSILDFLSGQNKNNVPLIVAVEGAQGALHPEYLDLLPEYPEINEAIVSDLTEKGELTGSELFARKKYIDAINGNKTSKKISVVGIESPGLYRENLKTFRTLLFKQGEIDPLMAAIHKNIEAAKSLILSADLKKFVTERERRKQGNYGNNFMNDDLASSPQMIAYLHYLSETAKNKLALDMGESFEQVRFPNLVRILALEKLAKAVDKRKAGQEKNELIAQLKSRVRSDEDRKVMALFEKIESQRDVRSIIEKVWLSAKSAGIKLDGRRSLWAHLGILAMQSEIDFAELSREMTRLENWIIEKLVRSAEEKRLVKWLDQFGLFEKLIRLELTRDEDNELVSMKDEILRTALGDELNDLAGKGRNSKSLVLSAGEKQQLSMFAADALKFYDGARERDKAILGNSLKLSKDSPVVLITGGFHTEGLTALMKTREVGYSVVQPHLTKAATDTLYHQVMRDQHADISAYFDKPYLNKQEAIYLKSLLEIAIPRLWQDYQVPHAEIAPKIAQAINRHPVLSKKIHANSESQGVKSTLKLEFKGPALQTQKGSEVAAASQAVPDVFLTEDAAGYDYLRDDLGMTAEVPQGVFSLTVQPAGTIVTARAAPVLDLPAQEQPVALSEARKEVRGIVKGNERMQHNYRQGPIALGHLAYEYEQYNESHPEDTDHIWLHGKVDGDWYPMMIPVPKLESSQILHDYLRARIFNVLILTGPSEIKLTAPAGALTEMLEQIRTELLTKKVTKQVRDKAEVVKSFGNEVNVVKFLHGMKETDEYPITINDLGPLTPDMDRIGIKQLAQVSARRQLEVEREQAKIKDILAKVNQIQGLALGIDIGGTDVKFVVMEEGQDEPILTMEYVWGTPLSAMKSGEEISGTVIKLIKFVIARVALEKTPADQYQELKTEALHLLEVKDVEGIGEFYKKVLQAGIEIKVPSSIGGTFPDVVANDEILGGETSKTKGMRDALGDKYREEFERTVKPLAAIVGKAISDWAGEIQGEPLISPIPVAWTNDGKVGSVWAMPYLESSLVFNYAGGTSAGGGVLNERAEVPERMYELGYLVTMIGESDMADGDVVSKFGQQKHDGIEVYGVAQQQFTQAYLITASLNLGLITREDYDDIKAKSKKAQAEKAAKLKEAEEATLAAQESEASGDAETARAKKTEAAAKISEAAKIKDPMNSWKADKVKEMQNKFAKGDTQARKIFETMAEYLALMVAATHYGTLKDHYEYMPLFGRMVSAESGKFVADYAQQVIREHFEPLKRFRIMRASDLVADQYPADKADEYNRLAQAIGTVYYGNLVRLLQQEAAVRSEVRSTGAREFSSLVRRAVRPAIRYLEIPLPARNLMLAGVAGLASSAYKISHPFRSEARLQLLSPVIPLEKLVTSAPASAVAVKKAPGTNVMTNSEEIFYGHLNGLPRFMVSEVERIITQDVFPVEDQEWINNVIAYENQKIESVREPQTFQEQIWLLFHQKKVRLKLDDLDHLDDYQAGSSTRKGVLNIAEDEVRQKLDWRSLDSRLYPRFNTQSNPMGPMAFLTIEKTVKTDVDGNPISKNGQPLADGEKAVEETVVFIHVPWMLFFEEMMPKNDGGDTSGMDRREEVARLLLGMADEQKRLATDLEATIALMRAELNALSAQDVQTLTVEMDVQARRQRNDLLRKILRVQADANIRYQKAANYEERAIDVLNRENNPNFLAHLVVHLLVEAFIGAPEQATKHRLAGILGLFMSSNPAEGVMDADSYYVKLGTSKYLRHLEKTYFPHRDPTIGSFYQKIWKTARERAGSEQGAWEIMGRRKERDMWHKEQFRFRRKPAVKTDHTTPVLDRDQYMRVQSTAYVPGLQAQFYERIREDREYVQHLLDIYAQRIMAFDSVADVQSDPDLFDFIRTRFDGDVGRFLNQYQGSSLQRSAVDSAYQDYLVNKYRDFEKKPAHYEAVPQEVIDRVQAKKIGDVYEALLNFMKPASTQNYAEGDPRRYEHIRFQIDDLGEGQFFYSVPESLYQEGKILFYVTRSTTPEGKPDGEVTIHLAKSTWDLVWAKTDVPAAERAAFLTEILVYVYVNNYLPSDIEGFAGDEWASMNSLHFATERSRHKWISDIDLFFLEHTENGHGKTGMVRVIYNYIHNYRLTRDPMGTWRQEMFGKLKRLDHDYPNLLVDSIETDWDVISYYAYLFEEKYADQPLEYRLQTVAKDFEAAGVRNAKIRRHLDERNNELFFKEKLSDRDGKEVTVYILQGVRSLLRYMGRISPVQSFIIEPDQVDALVSKKRWLDAMSKQLDALRQRLERELSKGKQSNGYFDGLRAEMDEIGQSIAATRASMDRIWGEKYPMAVNLGKGEEDNTPVSVQKPVLKLDRAMLNQMEELEHQAASMIKLRDLLMEAAGYPVVKRESEAARSARARIAAAEQKMQAAGTAGGVLFDEAQKDSARARTDLENVDLQDDITSAREGLKYFLALKSAIEAERVTEEIRGESADQVVQLNRPRQRRYFYDILGSEGKNLKIIGNVFLETQIKDHKGRLKKIIKQKEELAHQVRRIGNEPAKSAPILEKIEQLNKQIEDIKITLEGLYAAAEKVMVAYVEALQKVLDRSYSTRQEFSDALKTLAHNPEYQPQPGESPVPKKAALAQAKIMMHQCNTAIETTHKKIAEIWDRPFSEWLLRVADRASEQNLDNGRILFLVIYGPAGTGKTVATAFIRDQFSGKMSDMGYVPDRQDPYGELMQWGPLGKQVNYLGADEMLKPSDARYMMVALDTKDGKVVDTRYTVVKWTQIYNHDSLGRIIEALINEEDTLAPDDREAPVTPAASTFSTAAAQDRRHMYGKDLKFVILDMTVFSLTPEIGKYMSQVVPILFKDDSKRLARRYFRDTNPKELGGSRAASREYVANHFAQMQFEEGFWYMLPQLEKLSGDREVYTWNHDQNELEVIVPLGTFERMQAQIQRVNDALTNGTTRAEARVEVVNTARTRQALNSLVMEFRTREQADTLNTNNYADTILAVEQAIKQTEQGLFGEAILTVSRLLQTEKRLSEQDEIPLIQSVINQLKSLLVEQIFERLKSDTTPVVWYQANQQLSQLVPASEMTSVTIAIARGIRMTLPLHRAVFQGDLKESAYRYIASMAYSAGIEFGTDFVAVGSEDQPDLVDVARVQQLLEGDLGNIFEKFPAVQRDYQLGIKKYGNVGKAVRVIALGEVPEGQRQYKPLVSEMVVDSKFPGVYLGVDIGGGSMRFGLIIDGVYHSIPGELGKLQTMVLSPMTGVQESGEEFVKRFAAHVRAINETLERKIEGIGIDIPGAVDIPNNRIATLGQIAAKANWAQNDIDNVGQLIPEATKALGLPVNRGLVRNDMDGVMGGVLKILPASKPEFWVRTNGNFRFDWMGSGHGHQFAVRGLPFPGPTEGGHLFVDFGKPGETIYDTESRTSIPHLIESAIEKGFSAKVLKPVVDGQETLNVKPIGDAAADKSNPLHNQAIEVFKEFAYYYARNLITGYLLAELTGGVVNAADVLLGGGITRGQTGFIIRDLSMMELAKLGYGDKIRIEVMSEEEVEQAMQGIGVYDDLGPMGSAALIQASVQAEQQRSEARADPFTDRYSFHIGGSRSYYSVQRFNEHFLKAHLRSTNPKIEGQEKEIKRVILIGKKLDETDQTIDAKTLRDLTSVVTQETAKTSDAVYERGFPGELALLMQDKRIVGDRELRQLNVGNSDDVSRIYYTVSALSRINGFVNPDFSVRLLASGTLIIAAGNVLDLLNLQKIDETVVTSWADAEAWINDKRQELGPIHELQFSSVKFRQEIGIPESDRVIYLMHGPDRIGQADDVGSKIREIFQARLAIGSKPYDKIHLSVLTVANQLRRVRFELVPMTPEEIAAASQTVPEEGRDKRSESRIAEQVFKADEFMHSASVGVFLESQNVSILDALVTVRRSKDGAKGLDYVVSPNRHQNNYAILDTRLNEMQANIAHFMQTGGLMEIIVTPADEITYARRMVGDLTSRLGRGEHVQRQLQGWQERLDKLEKGQPTSSEGQSTSPKGRRSEARYDATAMQAEMFAAARGEVNRFTVIGRDWNKDVYQELNRLVSQNKWEEAVAYAKAHYAEGKDRLGWVDIVDRLVAQSELLTPVEEEAAFLIANRDEVVFSGMGGSSLSVHLVNKVWARQEGQPQMRVLDSTAPEYMRQTLSEMTGMEPSSSAKFRARLTEVLKKKHFVFIGKSGTTAETTAHLRWVEKLYAWCGLNAKDHIWLVSDLGSPFEKESQTKGYAFKSIQLDGKTDIGGRYTTPGTRVFLLPYAIRVSPKLFPVIKSVQDAHKADAQNDKGYYAMAEFLGKQAQNGYDKLMFLTPKALASVGSWDEQLKEESLGKEGKGFTVYPGKTVTLNDLRKGPKDTVFLHITIAGQVDEHEKFVKSLKDRGYPVWDIELASLEELPSMLYGFQKAVAAAGVLQGINVTNQPAIEFLKAKTREVEKAAGDKDAVALRIQEAQAANTDYVIRDSKTGITLVIDGFLEVLKARVATIPPALATAIPVDFEDEIISLTRRGASAAEIYAELLYMLSWLNKSANPVTRSQLTHFGFMPKRLRNALDRANKTLTQVTGIKGKVSEAPQMLHSIEQQNEGGVNNGFFTVMVASQHEKLPPEVAFTDQLIKIQTVGNYNRLIEGGRQAVMVVVPEENAQGIKALDEFFIAAGLFYQLKQLVKSMPVQQAILKLRREINSETIAQARQVIRQFRTRSEVHGPGTDTAPLVVELKNGKKHTLMTGVVLFNSIVREGRVLCGVDAVIEPKNKKVAMAWRAPGDTFSTPDSAYEIRVLEVSEQTGAKFEIRQPATPATGERSEARNLGEQGALRKYDRNQAMAGLQQALATAGVKHADEKGTVLEEDVASESDLEAVESDVLDFLEQRGMTMDALVARLNRGETVREDRITPVELLQGLEPLDADERIEALEEMLGNGQRRGRRVWIEAPAAVSLVEETKLQQVADNNTVALPQTSGNGNGQLTKLELALAAAEAKLDRLEGLADRYEAQHDNHSTRKLRGVELAIKNLNLAIAGMKKRIDGRSEARGVNASLQDAFAENPATAVVVERSVSYLRQNAGLGKARLPEEVAGVSHEFAGIFPKAERLSQSLNIPLEEALARVIREILRGTEFAEATPQVMAVISQYMAPILPTENEPRGPVHLATVAMPDEMTGERTEDNLYAVAAWLIARPKDRVTIFIPDDDDDKVVVDSNAIMVQFVSILERLGASSQLAEQFRLVRVEGKNQTAALQPVRQLVGKKKKFMPVGVVSDDEAFLQELGYRGTARVNRGRKIPIMSSLLLTASYLRDKLRDPTIDIVNLENDLKAAGLSAEAANRVAVMVAALKRLASAA